MAIETTCAGCGQTLSVSEEHGGKRARCPSCGQIYTVPYSAAPTPNQFTSSEGLDPALAETLPGSGSDYNTPASEAVSEVDEFWMKTGDGAEYGPVDRANLNRWFTEGRVGADYQIRQGASGSWHSASIYEPQSAGGSNPYAESSFQPFSPASVTQPSAKQYAKPDPSGMVLSMGLIAWGSWMFCPLVIGWIFGLIAWVQGSAGLKEIQQGIADPTNVQLVKVGYYLGMVNVIISLLALIATFALFALSLVA